MSAGYNSLLAGIFVILAFNFVFMHIIKRIFSILFSSSAGGIYTLLFAAAIGVATFVENDFGTSAAQKVIFKWEQDAMPGKPSNVKIGKWLPQQSILCK